MVSPKTIGHEGRHCRSPPACDKSSENNVGAGQCISPSDGVVDSLLNLAFPESPYLRCNLQACNVCIRIDCLGGPANNTGAREKTGICYCSSGSIGMGGVGRYDGSRVHNSARKTTSAQPARSDSPRLTLRAKQDCLGHGEGGDTRPYADRHRQAISAAYRHIAPIFHQDPSRPTPEKKIRHGISDSSSDSSHWSKIFISDPLNARDHSLRQGIFDKRDPFRKITPQECSRTRNSFKESHSLAGGPHRFLGLRKSPYPCVDHEPHRPAFDHYAAGRQQMNGSVVSHPASESLPR
jgi:hypothetical protein